MDRRDLGSVTGVRSTAELPGKVIIFDDFHTGSGSQTAGAGALFTSAENWWGIGQWFTSGGQLTVASDATRAGQTRLSSDGSTAGSLGIDMGKNIIYKTNVAQLGIGAGTRRFGIYTSGSLSFATDTTDGVYVKHTAAGNFHLITRSASTETDVDTGIASASGVFHTFTLLITQTKVEIYIDEVLKGTSTTNIPASGPGYTAGYGNSTTTNNLGLVVNYLYLEQDR